MWTAKLLTKQKVNNQLRVVIELTSDNKIIHKEYYLDNPSKELIRQRIISDIDLLDKQEAFDVNEGQNIDLSQAVVPQPTQDDMDRRLYSIDIARLRKINDLILLGVLTGNEPQVIDLRNKIKAEFKPEYID